MILSSNDLKELSAAAEHAARIAGDHIKASLAKDFEVSYKEGADSLAAQVVTEVDRQSEALIIQELQSSLHKFDLALLSEEQLDDGQRLVKDYFWCIDPIDGTLAFTERRPGFAVSIALVSRSGTPVIGVVYDPSTDRLFSAIEGHGAFCNGVRWPAHNEQDSGQRDQGLLLPSDRSLKGKPSFEQIENHINGYSKQHHSGPSRFMFGAGAVLNACAVIENTPALYFKPPKPTPGGGSLWDFAATACLALEAGMYVSDFEGKPLDLNREDSTFMNHRGVIFASSETLADMAKSLKAHF